MKISAKTSYASSSVTRSSNWSSPSDSPDEVVMLKVLWMFLCRTRDRDFTYNKTWGTGWISLKSLWNYNIIISHRNNNILTRFLYKREDSQFGNCRLLCLIPGTVMKPKTVVSKLHQAEFIWKDGYRIEKQFAFIFSTLLYYLGQLSINPDQVKHERRR